MDTTEKQKIVEAARATHGEVFELEDEAAGLILFRRATKLEARQLKKDRDNEDTKYVADESFAKKVVVYPDAAGFEALLERLPFLSMNVTNECFSASGGKKLSAKKA